MNEFDKGVLWSIEKLRELQNTYRHESKWNHSSTTRFAPVELSDYLVIQFKRELKEKLENEQQ